MSFSGKKLRKELCYWEGNVRQHHMLDFLELISNRSKAFWVLVTLNIPRDWALFIAYTGVIHAFSNTQNSIFNELSCGLWKVVV